MSHIHTFVMHTLYLFIPFLVFDVFCSLSLTDRQRYAPKQRKSTLAQNPLHGSGSSSSDPHIPSHIDSVMKRPRRTSLRTFRSVVFIWNARSSCQISLTLLYPKSFRLRDWSPSVGSPKGVRLCSFKSFTPTCTTSIPLCLSLLWHSEVHIS